MNRLTASLLALGLAVAAAPAAAQSYPSSGYVGAPYGAYPQERGRNDGHGAQYDYARVVRVDPVLQSGYGNGSYGAGGQRCYTRRDGYAGNDGYYGNDRYGNDGYTDRDYRGDEGYRTAGSQTGRTVATVLGGVLGAAIGSQVGGGSARYATSAIGSMVGGIAGREVYEANQRTRYPQAGAVTVCDPVPAGDRYYPAGDRGVEAYDVTYDYAGRRYTTRTNYHPGDRIRVRVDVRPE